MSNDMDPRFQHHYYLIRRKLLAILGASFHVTGPRGEPLFFCRQKAFKLKEDIRLYGDESKTEEVLTIAARNVIDFSAAYDVVDTRQGQLVGTLRRKGFKSMLRDEWQILDARGQRIGSIKEDSTALAMVRRFLSSLVPQVFSVDLGGREVARFKQRFNPLIHKLEIHIPDFSLVDSRLMLGAATLIVAIEGRQG